MGTNPIPDHNVFSFDSDRTPTQSYANGKYGKRFVNLFKLEAGMLGILSPYPIRFKRTFLNLLREFPELLPK